MPLSLAPDQLIKQFLDSPWTATFLLKAVRNTNNHISDFAWIYFNAKACEVFSPAPIAPGKTVSEVFSNDELPGKRPRIEWYRKVMQTGLPLEEEHAYDQEGEQVGYRERILPYEDGVLVMRETITPYKTQVKASLQPEQPFQNAMNSSTNGVMTLEAVRNERNQIIDFTFIMLNEKAAHHFSYSAGELKGKGMASYVAELTETAMFKRYVALSETGGSYDLELTNSPTGLAGWYRETGARLENRLLIRIENITERRQKEEKLRQSEAMLLESQEIAQLGSFQWNPEMTEAIWTPQLFKIYGLEPYSISINMEWLGSIIHPEDRERFFAEVNPVIQNRKRTYSVEYRAFTADGQMKHLWARGKKLDGRLTGTVMDISERKELEIRNTQLTSRNEELDNFVYTASHDLRSPLTNIEMLVNLLINEHANQPESVALYVEHLQKSITQLKNTLQDLTSITEIHREEEKNLVNLPELMEEVQLALFKEIGEASAEIRTNLALPSLQIPRKHARSLLFNLISNAIKFRANDRKCLIQVSSQSIDGRAQLCISDNGIGIAEADQPKIFMIFKRLNPQVSGRGIGMYLAKRVIDVNNGTIEMKSKEHVGTTFIIEFPGA